MKIRIATLALAALAGPILAATPDLSGFDKVLFPIFLPTPVPGPKGSSHVTGGGISLYSRQAFDDFPAYPFPASPPEVGTLAAESPFPVVLEGPASGGRFVFLDKARSEEVWLGERHLTLARKGRDSEQISLPRVPESHSLAGTAWILRVPFGWRYASDDLIREAIPVERRVLRIYSFDDQPGEKVVVRLYLENTGPGTAASRVFEVALSRRDGYDPSFPYYGVLRLADICIPFSLHTPCVPGLTFRVELEPQSPGLRYWAFVAVTDRASQDMVFVEPRPGASSP